MVSAFSEGPSTQCLRSLVPYTIKGMVFGDQEPQILITWTLWGSEQLRQANKSPEVRFQLAKFVREASKSCSCPLLTPHLEDGFAAVVTKKWCRLDLQSSQNHHRLHYASTTILRYIKNGVYEGYIMALFQDHILSIPGWLQAVGTLRVQLPKYKIYLPKTIITIPKMETLDT